MLVRRQLDAAGCLHLNYVGAGPSRLPDLPLGEIRRVRHANNGDRAARSRISRSRRQIDRAFGRVGIKTVLECRRQPSRNHGRAGETMAPGHRLTLPVEPCGNSVEPKGPVHVVLNVFLTRPHDLHGTVDMLGDLDGADRAVGLQPAAEAAADQMIVDDDLLWRQACGFAAIAWTRAIAWLPIQISHSSLRKCAVQFIGSIVACARNGT